MRNLILLFIRNGGLVLFLLLEGVCMFFVVQFNRNQKNIFGQTVTAFGSSIEEYRSEATKYYNVSNVLDSLSRENARLYAEVDNAKLRRSPWRDTVIREEVSQFFTFIPAKVISNSISDHNNELRLAVGTDQGVEPGMGVIGQNGLIGIVTHSSRNFSKVMSVLHRQSRISAAIKGNDYFGFVIWRGVHPMKVKLIDVPKHAQPHRGDTIVTSGFSTIFPPNLMIGTIDTFSIESGSNSWDIDVTLSNDIARAKYVYVAENAYQEELRKLEEEVADE